MAHPDKRIMAQTHGIGKRYFWHWITLGADVPVVHRGYTQEIERPYRIAFPLIIKVLPRWSTAICLVVGKWLDTTIGQDDEYIDAVLQDTLEIQREAHPNYGPGTEWDWFDVGPWTDVA